MIVFPLGVGGAFTMRYFHTNFIVEQHEQRLLIDCGTTIRQALQAAQLQASDIDAIYITHLHADHVGGLCEVLLLAQWHFVDGVHTPKQPTLFLRRAYVEEIDGLLAPMLNNQQKTWRDFCKVIVVDDTFSFAGVSYSVIPTDNLHCDGMKSSGLKIDNTTHNIIISGDLKHIDKSPLPHFVDARTRAIVHDVNFTKNGVHAHIDDILAFYPAAILRKLIAIHYEDDVPHNVPLPLARERKHV